MYISATKAVMVTMYAKAILYFLKANGLMNLSFSQRRNLKSNNKRNEEFKFKQSVLWSENSAKLQIFIKLKTRRLRNGVDFVIRR
jgi:hypothetical protein